MGLRLWICVNCQHVWPIERSDCHNCWEKRRRCGLTISPKQIRLYFDPGTAFVTKLRRALEPTQAELLDAALGNKVKGIA